MTNEPDQLSEGGWSELEQGFFESAPPDAPGPAPEPLRFDDLDALPATAREHPERPNRVRTAAAQARTALRSWSGGMTAQKVRPALTRTYERSRQRAVAAWRRSALALGAARRTLAANIETLSDRIIAMVPVGSTDRRAVASALAALVVMTGLSAGVVASRGAGAPVGRPAAPAVAVQHAAQHAAPHVAPHIAIAGATVLCAAPVDAELSEPGVSAYEPPVLLPAAPIAALRAPQPSSPAKRHHAVKRSVAQRKLAKSAPAPTAAPAKSPPAKPSAVPAPAAQRVPTR